MLFSQDQNLYPVEIKLGATVRRDWIRNFSVLEKLGTGIGDGAVLCLTEKSLPISAGVQAIPIGAV